MEWFKKIRARREELRIPQGDLASAVGVSQAAINKIEHGKVRSTRVLPMIAAYLNIPLQEVRGGLPQGYETDAVIQKGTEVLRHPEIGPLITGFGGSIPVFASVEAGEGELVISSDPISRLPRPEPLEGAKEGFGVYVVGHSMEPEFEPGDTALVHPRLPVLPNTPCIFYANDPGNTRAMIKRLVRIAPDKWTVRQWNPPPGGKSEFTLRRSDWPICWRVVGKFSRK